jgi:phosphatidylglycerol:prolipoprotein diacylglycerol transferase
LFTIDIDPVAFTIGPLTVRWYGIMVALAVVALLAISSREAKRLSISQDFIYNLFLWGIIGGFIISRLVHVVDYVVTHPGEPIQIIGFAGLSLLGAIGGAVLAVWIYTRVSKIPWSDMAGVGDAVAVGGPLAQAIGRIGCTINGCCYGKLSPFNSFPGAVIYAPPPHGISSRQWYDIDPQYLGIPLYPTQIYFLLWNLVVFAVLWRMRGRVKPPGALFLLYLCLYAAGDFGLRFFRVNDIFLLGLYQGQIISLVILLVALPLFIIKMRRYQQESLEVESINEASQMGQSPEE